MLKRIFEVFLKRKLLKDYYDKEAEKIMNEYLKGNKDWIGIYDKKGQLKAIQRLEVM